MFGVRATTNIGPFRYALKAFIEDERLNIPVLPTTATKVLSILKDQSVDAGDLTELIEKDQSLASNIIRVCNSPVYGGRKNITSLQQAIARLGGKALRRIVLMHALMGKVFLIEGFEEEADVIWEHTRFTGVWCKEIAVLCNTDPEEAYLIGLLHSVGKPVILQSLDDLRNELKMKLTKNDGLALMQEFHPLVGAKVAKQWSLPEEVSITCLHYPDFSLAPTEHQRIVAIVHLAHLMARHMIDKEDIREDNIFSSQSVSWLKLTPVQVSELLDQQHYVRQVA